MSATDELRRMLDERGVEYASSASGRSVYIGPNTTAFANYSEDTLDVSMRNLTPQLVIESTLGRGTCHDVAIEGEWFECSECGTVKQLIHPHYCPKCGRRVVAGDA